MEIILGKERRRWSVDEKRAIVVETFAPGVVILDIAKRRQISSGQIHTWRKQYRAELGFPAPAPAPPSVQPVRFMPLAIAADPAPTTIDVELAGGVRVRISGAVGADMVAALVKTLAQRSSGR